MHAAFHGHTEFVRFLLKAGAHVNARTASGNTALTDPISADYTEVVPILLRAGADPACETVSGWMHMTIAAQHGLSKVVKLLHNAGAKVNSATPAAGVGLTPLLVAAQHGHAETVQFLCDVGADTMARARGDQCTTLNYASEQGTRTRYGYF